MSSPMSAMMTRVAVSLTPGIVSAATPPREKGSSRVAFSFVDRGLQRRGLRQMHVEQETVMSGHAPVTGARIVSSRPPVPEGELMARRERQILSGTNEEGPSGRVERPDGVGGGGGTCSADWRR